MEARIARLESDVSHLRADVAEIKLDLRSFRDKHDQQVDQVNARIESVRADLTAKYDNLKDTIASAKVWALTLYIALAAVNLGTLARGFGWL
jgi:hypothetical protein